MWCLGERSYSKHAEQGAQLEPKGVVPSQGPHSRATSVHRIVFLLTT